MFNKKNKKGISPLIATVLIIGFTIVLAALVITWGTKLFKTTVGETESTSKFNLACTTGLNIEATPKVVRPNANDLELTMRNNNPDRAIDSFQFLLYDANNNVDSIKTVAATGAGTFGVVTADPVKAIDVKLAFPVPKTYIMRQPNGLPVGTPSSTLTFYDKVTKVEVYPIFTIDGVTKACSTPVEVKIGA